MKIYRVINFNYDDKVMDEKLFKRYDQAIGYTKGRYDQNSVSYAEGRYLKPFSRVHKEKSFPLNVKVEYDIFEDLPFRVTRCFKEDDEPYDTTIVEEVIIY